MGVQMKKSKLTAQEFEKEFNEKKNLTNFFTEEVDPVTHEPKKQKRTEPKSLNQIRREIKKQVDPRLELAANKLGGSYYYFYSNDPELASKLVRLESTTILIYSWKYQSLEQWIQDARDIIEETTKV